MAKRELIYFYYIFKSYAVFFLIPPFILLIVMIEFQLGMQEVGKGLIALLLFPSMVFPVVGMMGAIGSLEQKELLITYPISPWKHGFFRPLAWGSIWALLFSIIAAYFLEIDRMGGPFASVLLYIAIAAFLTSLFKHAGFGLAGALFYLIFGLFTTGMGQGPLYLGQWYRPRPFVDVDAYMAIQFVAAILLYMLTAVCIKYRHHFHLLHEH